MHVQCVRDSLLRGTALVLLATACTGTPGGAPASGDAAATARVDSIVLERTVCFGFCPAYRLSIGGDGGVHFGRMAMRDSTPPPAERDTIADSLVAQLLSRARAIDFFSLPEEITPNNHEACPQVATDHPSAIITIAVGDTVKRVTHYHGCHANVGMNPAPAFPELMALENAIDSAVRVERWLPGGR
jgi:hypothetical protein